MALVAQAIADYDGKEIVLKKYTDFHSFDKDFVVLSSIKDINKTFGFDSEKGDSLSIVDKDRNPIAMKEDPFIRVLLSYYESNKCSAFIRWIFNPLGDPADLKNVGILKTYFEEKKKNLERYTSKGAYCTEGLKAEATRLSGIADSLVKNLECLEDKNANVEYYSKPIHDAMEAYVHKDGKFNYAYMRKLMRELASRGYKFKKPTDIVIDPITEQEQDALAYDYWNVINKNTLQPSDDDEYYEDMVETFFAMNGENPDEIPFFEDFIEREKKAKKR